MRRQLLVTIFLLSTIARSGEVAPVPPPQQQDPATPERGWFKDQPNAWNNSHKLFVERAKKGGIEVLFLGDSLTQGLSDSREFWKKNFEPLKAANFGLAGDRTQQLLWRIQNGELEGIKPKVVVLMIGSNHAFTNDSAEKVNAGTRKVVEAVRAKLPETKILLLAGLPVSKGSGDPARAKIKAINALNAKLDDGKMVRFLDMGAKFVESDGGISEGLYQVDFVHLKPKGYELWAETMRPVLSEMLK